MQDRRTISAVARPTATFVAPSARMIDTARDTGRRLLTARSLSSEHEMTRGSMAVESAFLQGG
jgi:hypothetical protein